MEIPKTNKEKILSVSIRLFAQKGYSNVSMREIAKEVGIQAASIYNHYPSKSALLNDIADYFKEQMMKEIYPSFEITEDSDVRSFIENTINATDRFFKSLVFMDIGNIILHEQFENKKINVLLLEELIRKPREAFALYFSKLMELGRMRSLDPILIAKEYHAYFIYRFYENSLAMNYSQMDSAQSKAEQNAHVQLFLDNYCL